ncbi:MAG: DMT family transporter [Verrucomicrobiae bacterium]|nr:DMT family transporter [Verrucomicrobiae bacterium]
MASLLLSSSILFTVAGYLLMVPFAIRKTDLHLTPSHLLPFLVGVSYVVGNLVYYKLAESMDVPRLAPATALYVLVSILLGWCVLREPITAQRVLGVVLAGVAIRAEPRRSTSLARRTGTAPRRCFVGFRLRPCSPRFPPDLPRPSSLCRP